MIVLLIPPAIFTESAELVLGITNASLQHLIAGDALQFGWRIQADIPEIATDVRGEEAVNEWISCRIERGHALNERGYGCHRFGAWDVTVDLK